MSQNVTYKPAKFFLRTANLIGEDAQNFIIEKDNEDY